MLITEYSRPKSTYRVHFLYFVYPTPETRRALPLQLHCRPFRRYRLYLIFDDYINIMTGYTSQTSLFVLSNDIVKKSMENFDNRFPYILYIAYNITIILVVQSLCQNLSIIIPTYNDAQQLGTLTNHLAAVPTQSDSPSMLPFFS